MINDRLTLLDRLNQAPDWTHISVRVGLLKELLADYENERQELLPFANRNVQCRAHNFPSPATKP